MLPGATDTDVFATIDSYLTNAGISGHTRTCSPSAGTATAGTAVRVTVSVSYTNVSWLPAGAVNWLRDKTLSASVEMRKEEY